MDKILKLYKHLDGGIIDTPFPNSDNPIEIGEFRYDAKRMGGAPTITASVNYPSCLDDEWTDNVYAEFNGEKYFLKQTPTSSYDNVDTMYKHDITLVSERVALDNVYFFDVVTGNPMDSDKPVSNSTKVVFFGDVREFASRLQASLEYSGLDYTVVVDDEVISEEKLMSFEDQFFSNVLQEIYNTYEVPYYFVGKTIHIGDHNKLSEDEQLPVFAYGVDDALLSITKNNANYKIVNRATGTGSSDNIPFYYPNNSPKGEISAKASSQRFNVTIKDYEKFANSVGIDKTIIYDVNVIQGQDYSGVFDTKQIEFFDRQHHSTKYNIEIATKFDGEVSLEVSSSMSVKRYKWQLINDDDQGYWDWVDMGMGRGTITVIVYEGNKELTRSVVNGSHVFGLYLSSGNHTLTLVVDFQPEEYKSKYVGTLDLAYSTNVSGSESYHWFYEGKQVDLQDLGLSAYGDYSIGDTITQTLVKYVNTSKFLMPFKYRETDGKERFYNATNDTYEGVTFNNPFVEGHPKEHIITVEDIKPSIKEMVNSMGLRMDMFSEFAYDLDDNDELVENEEGSEHEYVHSYFFAKLRKLDFNLFDHAIEQQPMTISFTSGDCGACNFEIGVTEEFPQKNPVQVNADGTLKRDEKGRVICGQFEEITEDECQPQQQDTINNEVWIALKKEDSTYGILMPKAPTKDEQGNEVGGHRPKACSIGKNDGDTFVILGINLPYEYIEHAEKKLEAEIIKYLKDNNDEKFTFSISFSRIYFAENPDILPLLSENSKIKITYNNKEYDLYVSSYSYSMGDNDTLPEIRVELDETLKVSQNALQNAISQVKSELGRAIGNIDVLGATTTYFIRKDVDDEARGKINFTKGIKFGEGGKVEVMDNNSVKLTIEYLEVTKKASFTSLEIQEKTHVGGQILVTPASINCGEVEELDDVYRCYFQTKGADGDEIFNQFAVGDQAICQTYNAWGSKYYWRLVTGIGEDYIDLSKTECDEDSGIPSAGDKIIQLGNQADTERQNAIVIAAYGDGSPYIIQYKGIDSFEIGDDKIVTKLSSTENIFTGKVHMEMGSDGLNQLPEWIEVKDKAEEALEKAGSINEEAFAELEQYVEGVRQELQEQIDGAVDSYFEDYEPSTSNYPAKDWTIEEKESHLNDTFTNLTDGRSWRWSKAAGAYVWVEIADTATSEALKIAGQAKESADRKMRMFVEQPYTPYSIGDLWSRGEEAPLMRCIKDKESGSFSEEDWALADNSQSYTDEAISNINIGGTNLLRNSGFTGDYLSEQLADEKVLEGAAELYSSPLDHWTTTAATVIDSDDTISGKAVSLTSGTLSQDLYYNTVVGAEYVLSFKAKGEGVLSFTVGDANGSVSLTSEMAFYEVVVTPTTSSDTFVISDATCIIGDLKLEKGNKATSWSASPLDNTSDRAYYQSMKYIQNAFEGATDVLGGLVLTEQIQVGDYNPEKKEWVKMNGGMSGVYESDHDVAFWAGGNINQAIETVMKYADDPTYQPTEEELVSMAKFVVTHGGRAILNDVILRGLVYGTGGEFSGKVNATSGEFNNVNFHTGQIGDIQVLFDPYDGSMLSFGDYATGEWLVISNGSIGCGNRSRSDKVQSVSMGDCTGHAMLITVDKAPYCTNRDIDVGLEVNVPNAWAHCVPNGVFAGLRPKTRVISSAGTSLNRHVLDEFDFSVLINRTSGTCYLEFPESPLDGQEYIIETIGAYVDITSSKPIYSLYGGASQNTSNFKSRGALRYKYYAGASMWTVAILASV